MFSLSNLKLLFTVSANRWKLYLVLFSLMVVGTMGGYFWWSQNRFDELKSQQQSLREMNAALSFELGLVRQDAQRLFEASEKFNKDVEAIRTQQQQANKVLLEHDLGKLASRKPRLIEKRANEATEKALRDLEEITRK